MITISHIFPIESPYCQFSGKSESPVNSLITKFTEYCVLKCPNSVTVRNLLFQCAVSHATKESDVTYICRQPLDTLPLGVHGMPRPEADVLKSVKFLYLKTVDELVEFCASIHNKVVGPDLIVVDDIDGYIEQFKGPCPEHQAAKLCSLLCDAVHFINTKHGGSCCLLLSCMDSSNHLSSVFKSSGIQIFNIKEIYSGDYRLSFVQGSNSIGVEFCIQKDAVYLREFNATEKLKQGNSTGK